MGSRICSALSGWKANGSMRRVCGGERHPAVRALGPAGFFPTPRRSSSNISEAASGFWFCGVHPERGSKPSSATRCSLAADRLMASRLTSLSTFGFPMLVVRNFLQNGKIFVPQNPGPKFFRIVCPMAQSPGRLALLVQAALFSRQQKGP